MERYFHDDLTFSFYGLRVLIASSLLSKTRLFFRVNNGVWEGAYRADLHQCFISESNEDPQATNNEISNKESIIAP